EAGEPLTLAGGARRGGGGGPFSPARGRWHARRLGRPPLTAFVTNLCSARARGGVDPCPILWKFSSSAVISRTSLCCYGRRRRAVSPGSRYANLPRPAAVSTTLYASSRASTSAASTKDWVSAAGAEKKEPRLPGAPLRSSRGLISSRI